MKDIADEIIRAMNANDEYIDTLRALAPMVPLYDLLDYCLAKNVSDETIKSVLRDAKLVEVLGMPYLYLLAHYNRVELLGYLASRGVKFFVTTARYHDVNADGTQVETHGHPTVLLALGDDGLYHFGKYTLSGEALQTFVGIAVTTTWGK